MTNLLKRISLRTQIFISMILLMFLACLLIFVATSVQYQNESIDYNNFRLNRKENQLQKQIDYLVVKNDLLNKKDSVWAKYKEEFSAVIKIHNVNYSVFNLEGKPLFTSFLPLKIIANNYSLDSDFLEVILSQPDRFLEKNNDEIGKFQSSYSVLKDGFGNPYGILFFPYFEDVSFSENELNTFLQSLYQIYLFMLLVAIIMAYFISKYISRSLETFREKIDQTGLLKQNEKIQIKNAPRDIASLINSYNKMIDELEKSATLLARTQREQAWREMAKQVAHEIKNPLTPMRLTVQNFQRKFSDNDPDNAKKIDEFSQILIEQIDTMSDVANAFSDFATLPKPKLTPSDLVEVTRRSLEIFENDTIEFNTSHEQIQLSLDRTQWVRVVTNIIQNALQAVKQGKQSQIKVSILKEKETVKITFEDNGMGIPKSIQSKVFEPKFTTKSKGMGLGLGIVKNIIDSHKGAIGFTTGSKGTSFVIVLNL
ncbi:MAG: sensor histidine kinase [Flavobacteriia bacterium]|nr:sensor histidine kinase [Flavobacteriia bacterium]